MAAGGETVDTAGVVKALRLELEESNRPFPRVLAEAEKKLEGGGV